MTAPSGWVNTQEAGEILAMPRGSVAVLASRGQIEGRKVGREWLLRRDAVEQYLSERRGRS